MKKIKTLLLLIALGTGTIIAQVQTGTRTYSMSSGGTGIVLKTKDNPGGSGAPFLIWDAQSGGANYKFGIRQEGNRLRFNRYSGSGFGNGKNLLDITSDGKVGIGVSNPSSKFEVAGSGLFRSGILDIAFTTPSGRNGIVFDSDNSNNFSRVDLYNVPSSNTNNRLFVIRYSTDSGGIALRKGGNVGIGTFNTGSYKLAVNGKVRAKEIVCETGWSDFVFEDDYDLPSLSEVNKFIKENGHLKDIPSTEEVEKDGVALAKISSKLLQKIEELTLYAIQQNEEIRMLKTRLNNLEK